jgi:hypothetical protein
MMKTKLFAISAVGLGGLVTFGHANAAINWNLTSPTSSSPGSTINNASTSSTNTYRTSLSNVGNTLTANGTGEASAPGVTASAWANTGNGVWDCQPNCSYNNEGREQIGANTNNDAYLLESAYLANYGSSNGLGVTNRDTTTSTSYGDYSEGVSPEHAVDNNQRNDMVLFSFGQAVNLTQVILGWSQQCADITVLAYQGSNPLPLSGLQYSTLDNNGWTVIGHYANAAQGSTDITVNLNTTVSSSYWLIGAYNPSVGTTGLIDNGCDGLKVTTSGSTTCSGTYTVTTLNAANVKIAGLVGKTPPPNGNVPEPGTLGLLGLGLVGMFKSRKRLSRSA